VVVLMKSVRELALIASCAWIAGCIGTSPEQAEADALGSDPSGQPNGPLHRAGFPCTRCHGDAWWQEDPPFALAGTIYGTSDDTRGLRDVEVIVRDAAGQELIARTNQSGNFFFIEEEGSAPAPRSDGSFQIPSDLAFPLRVSVRDGEHEQTMRGLIWRERSCAACHRREGTDEASNGPIFVREASP
jgi:hypothetical protein